MFYILYIYLYLLSTILSVRPSSDHQSPQFHFFAAGDGDCELAVPEEYDMGLAIGSIFILFFASLLGAAIPTALSFSSRPWLAKSVKTLAYAGAGVLLATGFMHLLLPAQAALTSECLSESFLDAFPSWAFLFCVISIAVMQVVDYFITVKIAGKAPPSLAVENTPLPPPPPPSEHSVRENDASLEEGVCTVHPVCKDDSCNGQTLLKTHHHPTAHAQLAAVILSEASISVHSVLIGITLGITPGDEIVPLLIALTFHQFLEGVALGCAAVYAGLKTRSVLALAFIFAITTPIGIAVGIGIKSSYNSNSQTALLTQGILDAISAGLLIFLALGDHVNAVKSQAQWLKTEGKITHGLALGAFLVGVAVMCALAVWV